MGDEYFIVDIDRDRHRFGQKTFFYLYDMQKNKKMLFETDVPHIYCTPVIENDGERKRIFSLVQTLIENEKKSKPGFRMDLKENEKEKVIQITGDRGFGAEIEKAIGRNLIDYSVDKTILLRYPTSAIVTIEEGRLVNTGRRANLEEYFTNSMVNFADFDIETKGNAAEVWMPLKMVTRKDGIQISDYPKESLEKLCSFDEKMIKTDKGRTMFNVGKIIDYDTIYQIGLFIGNNEKEQMKKLLALEGYAPDKDGYELFVAKTQKDFSNELIKDLEGNNVLFVWNQNIKNFDLRKLRELADFDYARCKGGGAFQKEIHFPGFQVGDSFPFAMHYLGPLPRYNLERICDFLDIPFKKSLSHGELHKKVMSGNKEDLQEATDYLMKGDIIAAEMIAKRLTVPVIRIADAYEEPFTRVSNQTVKLATNLRERRYFERHGIPRHDRTIEMQDFEMYKELFNMLTNNWTNTQIREGVFENVKVVKSKLPRFLAMPHEDKISNLAKLGEESKDMIDKLIYSRAADAYCEEPLFDLLRLLDGEMSLYQFEKTYGNTYNFDAILMHDVVTRYAKESQIPIINYSKDLIFVPAGVKIPKDKYVEIATAEKIISVEKGRVVAKIGNKIISPGIDLEKKSNSMRFVKEMYPELAETYFEGGHEAVIGYFREKMHDFNSGKVPIEDLLIHVKRNQEIYSERAKGRFNIDIIEAMKLRKGQSGIALMNRKEAYRELWFGELTKYGKRKLSEGSLGDVLSIMIPEHAHRELYAAIGEGVNAKLGAYNEGGDIMSELKENMIENLEVICRTADIDDDSITNAKWIMDAYEKKRGELDVQPAAFANLVFSGTNEQFLEYIDKSDDEMFEENLRRMGSETAKVYETVPGICTKLGKKTPEQILSVFHLMEIAIPEADINEAAKMMGTYINRNGKLDLNLSDFIYVASGQTAYDFVKDTHGDVLQMVYKGAEEQERKIKEIAETFEKDSKKIYSVLPELISTESKRLEEFAETS